MLETLVPLLTAFGLGSIATALMQQWLAQRSKLDDRKFSEKQKAYIGLLEALHRAGVERTEEAAKNYAYWQARCELVAPPKVTAAIQSIADTNDDRDGRMVALDRLRQGMRDDLKLV